MAIDFPGPDGQKGHVVFQNAINMWVNPKLWDRLPFEINDHDNFQSKRWRAWNDGANYFHVVFFKNA